MKEEGEKNTFSVHKKIRPDMTKKGMIRNLKFLSLLKERKMNCTKCDLEIEYQIMIK